MLEDEKLPVEVLQERCQTIFYNLFVELNSARGGESAPVYARALMTTKRCDQFDDFKDVRRRFDEEIGQAACRVIDNFKETTEDEARAVQSMMQYKTWHRDELWNALLWQRKARYLLWDGVHETLAAIGMLSVPYGGYRAALKLWKDRKQNQAIVEELLKGGSKKN